MSFLTSVIVVATLKTRWSAIDVKRYQDLSVLQKALELYYQDHGYYPTTTAVSISSSDPQWQSELGTQLSSYLGSMPMPVVVKSIPPIGGLPSFTGNYIYQNISTTQHLGYNNFNLLVANPIRTVCLFSNGYVLGTWTEQKESYNNLGAAYVFGYPIAYQKVDYAVYGGSNVQDPGQSSDCPWNTNP